MFSWIIKQTDWRSRCRKPGNWAEHRGTTDPPAGRKTRIWMVCCHPALRTRKRGESVWLWWDQVRGLRTSCTRSHWKHFSVKDDNKKTKKLPECQRSCLNFEPLVVEFVHHAVCVLDGPVDWGDDPGNAKAEKHVDWVAPRHVPDRVVRGFLIHGGRLTGKGVRQGGSERDEGDSGNLGNTICSSVRLQTTRPC